MRLGPVRRLHFVGIGGVGMCGLAEVMQAEGAVVSGCDLAPSERTRRLESLGMQVFIGHSPEHLEEIDVLVVSSAVDPEHAELRGARERGLPILKRAQLLAEIMRSRHGVAVAGTHGKTTTTALVGQLLSAAGLDPLVIVGGRVRGLESHARLGRGELMVCEADEYDRSFLRLAPVHVVITNLEAEHLECYGSLAELEAAFRRFAEAVPFYGAVVYCADDPGAVRAVAKLERRLIPYGLGPRARVRAQDLQSGPEGSRFRVVADGEALGELHIPLAGDHNVRNALAALSVGLDLGLPFAELAAALAAYQGVARRFELLGEAGGVTVVDDYAHHPTEVRAVLEAARRAFAGRRLVVVFQPHLFSRTREFAEDFGRALASADESVVLPIYAAREKALPGVDAELVVAAARAAGGSVCSGPEPAACTAFLEQILKPGDVLLTLGAGDVHLVAEQWMGRAS